MQNREVPLGNLPIFFSSRRLPKQEGPAPECGGGDRARNAGYRPRNAGDGATGTGCRRRGTSPRAWTAARLHTPPPGPFTAGRPPLPDTQYARAIHCQAPPPPDTQSAGAFHGWTPAAGAILHRGTAPYLSRVRIRITPLPPRTPYMLLPRCTSTDLTS